jgi:hypothetical protein
MPYFRHFASLTTAVSLLFAACGSMAQPASSGSAASGMLLQKHAALEGRLAQNPYGRPLVIESSESDQRVSGHAYGVIDIPFATLSQQLKKPGQWCEVMILHLNTKYCRAEGTGANEQLKVSIGKKTPQSLADASTLEFAFKLLESSGAYFGAQLAAREGPLGTSDYRMELQAAPLPDGKTFLHLQYAYSYGLAGKLAMQAYLATSGRSKVGFTTLGSGNDASADKTRYVGGMRGAIERNTMRYYLAIEAYMASLQSPDSEQVNKRLNDWFTATEKYPRQLDEIDRASYLSMKKAEYQRQQSGV